MLTRSVSFSFCMPLNFKRSNRCCSSEYSRAELAMDVSSMHRYRGLPRARRKLESALEGGGASRKVFGCAESQNGAVLAKVEENLAQDVNLTGADGCP